MKPCINRIKLGVIMYLGIKSPRMLLQHTIFAIAHIKQIISSSWILGLSKCQINDVTTSNYKQPYTIWIIQLALSLSPKCHCTWVFGVFYFQCKNHLSTLSTQLIFCGSKQVSKIANAAQCLCLQSKEEDWDEYFRKLKPKSILGFLK